MQRFASYTLLLLLTLVCPDRSVAQAPDARSDVGANAAMKYWAGFALLPALDRDQERIVEEWNKVPLDAAALKLIERSELSRSYLQRGAKLSRCDWSLDYDDGISLVLPHLSKSLTLSRLTALHARHEFEQGHWQAGWDDVTAMLKLARHIEATPIMIASLVGYRIESLAIEVASPWLPELKAALPADAAAALDALPAAATLEQLLRTEKQMGPEWLMGKLKRAERTTPGSWQTIWKETLLGPGEEADNPLRKQIQAVTTFDQAIKMLDGQLPLLDQLTTLAARPWKEFDVQYQEFVKRTKSPNAAADFLLPNLNKFIPAQRQAQAQMALFKAALAVVQGGPDKLKAISDPFGDGPFEYRALDNGFELKSKLVFNDRPSTLTVGRPAKRR